MPHRRGGRHARLSAFAIPETVASIASRHRYNLHLFHISTRTTCNRPHHPTRAQTTRRPLLSRLTHSTPRQRLTCRTTTSLALSRTSRMFHKSTNSILSSLTRYRVRLQGCICRSIRVHIMRRNLRRRSCSPSTCIILSQATTSLPNLYRATSSPHPTRIKTTGTALIRRFSPRRPNGRPVPSPRMTRPTSSPTRHIRHRSTRTPFTINRATMTSSR
jgi:hypothetical protein